MTQPVTKQALIDASVDAATLEVVINGEPNEMVASRLGRQYPTLATVGRAVDDATAAVAQLESAIEIASAAGAGAAGWTDLLVATSFGGTQRDFNYSVILSNIDYEKTVTVGASGADFTTINDALNELSRYKQLYVKTNDAGNSKAKILLKSGFIAAEQININGVDFGWVDIVSEDEEVVISRAALTTKIGRWYPFIRCKSGTIPSIKTLFRMDATGTATERVALYMINSAGFIEVRAGFKNAAVRAVDLTQTSSLCASGGIFTGAGGVAIRPATGSSVFLQYADLSNSVAGLSCGSGASVAAEGLIATNCATTAVEVQGGCNVELSDSDLSGAGSFGLYAHKASVVGAANLLIDGGGGYGVYADNGATVDLSSATVKGCAGVAGVRATNGAYITANGITATGNNINLMATKGGMIFADVAVLTGAVSIGIAAGEGGCVIANNTNYRKGVADSTSDCSVSTGGRLFLHNTTGGVPQKTDVQLPAGIVYKGIKTKSRGQAAITAGLTSVVVTHTLPELPITLATPISSLGSATKWWLSNVGATTFQINIDATTSSAVTFHWSCELI